MPFKKTNRFKRMFCPASFPTLHKGDESVERDRKRKEVRTSDL